MSEKPEVVPGETEIEAVKSVIGEILINLESELKHSIGVSIDLMKDGSVVGTVGSAGQESETAHRGSARIRFRPTFFPDRYLFFIDSVFPRDDRSPSFSGFRVRGTVKPKSGGAVADYSAWSVKWNDREWARWL